MQVIAAGGPPPPFPRRAIIRLLVVAVSAALVVLLGGWVLQRAFLGSGEPAARARVERDVRQAFDLMAQQLRTIAAAVDDPVLVRQAAEDEGDDPGRRESAAGRLFGDARAAITEHGDSGEAAVTVFAQDRTPLAWAGRPSELPAERFGSAESYVFLATALGPRLIYVKPVATNADRAGTIVVERAISSADRQEIGGPLRLQGASRAVIRTPLAPVSVEPATTPLWKARWKARPARRSSLSRPTAVP